MRIEERYTWEAEKRDGTVITTGSDLTDCVRFSFIPAEGTGNPRHDLIGVRLKRRFNRGFHKVYFNDADDVPCKLGWRIGSSRVETPQDLTEFLQPGQMIRQRGPSELCHWYVVLATEPDHILIDRPFEGKEADCVSLRRHSRPPGEYLYCVACAGFRMYVRAIDGSVLITPEDYEVYL